MKKAIFTIVSNNYLHFARTLMQSVAKLHPECDRYCIIVDQDKSPSLQLIGEFTVINIDELPLPNQHEFIFQYSVLELNTAVKPWAFELLLNKGYSQLAYIDPDIKLYQPMTEVFDLLGVSSDIVITPHLLSPMTDDKKPTELDIRRAGTYNFGFCAIKKSNNSVNFLHWWQSKLLRDCVVDMDKGIFVDQSWVDLVPGLFEHVAILRHPGYNVAYWNLAQRKIEFNQTKGWTSNGLPLVFFHYSGLNPLNIDNFSKHQNRFNLSNMGEASQLAIQYANCLKQNGAKEYIKLNYGFSLFEDGSKVSDIFRKLYRTSEKLRDAMGENPFLNSTITSKLIPSDYQAQITWAMLALRDARPDLQQAFNLSSTEFILRYWDWFIVEGDHYFCPKTMSAHKQLLSQIAVERDSTLKDSQPYTEPQNDYVYNLFQSLLGRFPEDAALNHYVTLSKKPLGKLKTFTAIASSRECLARPKSIKKILSYIVKNGASIRNTPLRLNSYTKKKSDNQLKNDFVSFSGIFTPDADSKVNGLWCTNQIEIPLPSKTLSGLLKIHGNFFPAYKNHNKTHKPVTHLKIKDGDEVVSEIALPDTGIIDLTINLPKPSKQIKAFGIELSCSFIPKEIGLNDDTRLLAFRLKKLTLNEVVIVDATLDTPLMSLVDIRQDLGMNIIGYLSAELGVGEAARSMAKAANSVGIDYSAVDVSYQSANVKRDNNVLDNAKKSLFPVDIVYVNADQTPNTLQYLQSINYSKAQTRIGYWHWEQPILPQRYLSSFNGLDEIWVPTTFVHDAVSKISPLPVYKVPNAVEFTIPGKINRNKFGIPDGLFAVLVMYDFHSYKFRKNPEAAIEAYKQAAKNSNNSILVIKTMNAEKYPEDYMTLSESIKDIKNTLLIDKALTRDDVYELEACCDCMISLHRAEGFGLGPAEMMYLGKPVIATGWSGNMEFMTPHNSFPVNYTLKPLETAVGVYPAGPLWAEADVEHAAHCLESLINSNSLCQKIGSLAKMTIQSELSNLVIGKKYRERLALLDLINR